VIQDELVKIWEETRQTVFMITQDVDEAILLSDRIFLMSNGPHARIAESVQVSLPRPRSRASVFQEPGYGALRNYLVDFLVNRSAAAAPAANGEPHPIDPIRENPVPGRQTADDGRELTSTQPLDTLV
jgi:nitrate/nitrite transport system ATP-binding protein